MILYRVCGRFVAKANGRDRTGRAEPFAKDFLAQDDHDAKSFVNVWLADKRTAELVKLLRIDVVEETSLVKEFT